VAHSLYTPVQAARSTLAALRWLSSLPRTVRQDFSAEFVGGRGQTVNVKKPITAGVAHTYTPTDRTNRTAITFNDLTETYVPVTLNTQVYNAVRLPDDFATFTLESLEREVLIPQAESVVDALYAPLVAELVAIAAEVGETDGVTDANILSKITRARKVLNDRKVPFADRYLACGTEMAAKIIDLEQLTDASRSGSDGALREATMGRIRGFTAFEDPALPEDAAVAYHRDAFAFVTRPSRQPEGAAKSAIASQDGFSLRWIQHYNPLQLEDQSVVDTFVGAETLDATRAVKLTLAP
jgi:hypothetical protein